MPTPNNESVSTRVERLNTSVAPELNQALTHTQLEGLSMQVLPALKLNKEGGMAFLKKDRHTVSIKKLERGIQYSIDGREFKELYFKDYKDLNTRMGKVLDHELGRRRPHFGKEMKLLYTALLIT